MLGDRLSYADRRAGASMETGLRVKVTESTADRGAPAVGPSDLFALGGSW